MPLAMMMTTLMPLAMMMTTLMPLAVMMTMVITFGIRIIFQCSLSKRSRRSIR